ncbi:Hsp33 family molecular chaperone HslO [Shewanella oneidensis MR-1]|uniref:33 kDa chaperonin n=1 Tax=Shewanella oneidensis (strain ATCC 700550 / JCM 31522 / CIP 106686 / LMG 19005 / NCIMB 14063 / MR-1) TaxID=211586 RepID=HSLO_SHEON|nr:Hsp33 family molecular chaperone HslO [Shewanella oneidensis]Q8EKD2.1 RecName: Full=33 kDa chaperonin; AltName: Full=Heat shock protein 33 homolog; Short=HSP33 [Shewanella oneidensis MR-1]AAN53250.1 redox regulated chaperone HslO [Shewanella oneidensis MR-1]MDX5997866.1 Hsp33 family molecular chaperone HslO [Shewanella oneidensis]MEE2027856.1 33 kDa chaperonin [Shewanella oneidensis]QKG95125.1 Hsp33 family molecular chaperone HslO [Shewanella oneidensis MR-1]
MTQDILHRYLFDNADVRGELVQLQNSYQQVIGSHAYPPVLQTLLGELLAATSLLTATLKFSGDISVQLQGNGPVSLAVINGNNLQQLRGIARWDGELADDASLADLFGQGYMVITLTPDEGERYQGVVALDKPTLAACVEDYFNQSEQLPTALWLFADGKQAAGMFLQILPSQEDHNADFEHLCQLTATIKAEELFTLEAQEVLHRLYHQEEVRLFDPIEVSFKCTCSRERSAAAIKTIDQAEVEAILAEDGNVEMGCEYCNAKYLFDAIDIASIYANGTASNTQQ